jgi:YD repeat-containing protein
MAKRLVLMLLLFGLYHCFASSPAYGQSPNCTAPWYCGWYSFSSGCVPTPPAGAYNWQNIGPWSFVVTYLTTACAPPPPPCWCCCASGTGGAGGPGGPRAHGGKPIMLDNGDTVIEQTDLRIPGLSGGLTLVRTWNSLWPTQIMSQTGLFGPNWRSTYEERVFIGPDNYIKYSQGDGALWSFAYAGAAYAPVSPGNATATLVLSSDSTYWTLTFQNGEKRIFNYLGGYLIGIVDRNGNTTQISYDSINRLATITDPAGRHLYFGYANNSSYLVTSVTSDVGLSLTYTYDSQNRLSQVTYPDQTFVTFQYDSNSMITAVTDSAGKILESHTYDGQGRGLTSSRAGGVEAITVSY